MQRFDILDPKLNIFQSRFLEASAGTGKTFAIEHLVVRLLLESKEPIALQEILAVTFTREAAHEMKMRIRAKLEELRSEGNPRVREALANFDEIQVFTIHGFCHRMLTEFAFEARAPLQMASPDQPDHIEEMRKTVEDFFRTGKKKFAAEITELFKRSRYNFDRFVTHIVNAMQAKDPPQKFSLPDLPKISLEHLERDFFTLAPRYKRLKAEAYMDQLEKFSQFLKENDPVLLLEEKTWFFEKMHEGNVKLRAQPLASLPHFFVALQNKLLPPAKKSSAMPMKCSKESQLNVADGGK